MDLCWIRLAAVALASFAIAAVADPEVQSPATSASISVAGGIDAAAGIDAATGIDAAAGISAAAGINPAPGVDGASGINAAAAAAPQAMPALVADPPAGAAPSTETPAPVVAPAAASAAGAGPEASYALADRVVVRKSERKLYLMQQGRVIARYPIRLGLNPVGPKEREGDFRTPEGVYLLTRRNQYSDFFLSIGVSYPNETDMARARRQRLAPGGSIMIHGQPNFPRKSAEYYARNDWTDGCIAVSNSDMVDIWLRTRIGIPIEIRP